MSWKNFHSCFSKLSTCLPTIQPSLESSRPPEQTDSLGGPATSSTVTTAKNFNDSLFNDFNSDSLSPSMSLSISPSSADVSLCDYESVPDFASLFAAPRFFFSSPGRSKSIFDQSDNRTSIDYTLVIGGARVRTYSTDPLADFRRSMQEMIQARDQRVDVRNDWMYLQELLLCYLQINPKNTHKLILSAFSDLVVNLLASSPDATSGLRSCLAH